MGREIKILIWGKTGSGKSATANAILNEKFFEEDCFLESSNARSFTKSRELDGVTLHVTDTPGIFNTEMTETDIINQIKEGLISSNDGVHIILLVIRLNSKFTQEEMKAVELIQENLGEKARKHIMVLFTHGDALEKNKESLEKHLYRCQSMKKLVNECSSVYQVFNNKSRDKTQVTELLEKIDQIMRKNGDQLYTTEMFEAQQNQIKSEKEKDEKEHKVAQSKREKAEKEREEAQREREKAEKEREEAQREREKAEKEREEAQSKREKAEKEREEAQSKREKAEKERKETQSKREKAEKEREEAQSKREKAEKERKEAQREREKAEKEREEAQSKREKAEKEREEAETVSILMGITTALALGGLAAMALLKQ